MVKHMRAFRRSLVANGILATTIAILVTSPLASATSYPTYHATESAVATGGSPVNLYGPHPLAAQSTKPDILNFWQNSTVGQLGPSVAELGITQSFESGAYSTYNPGWYFFNVTWIFNGQESLVARCWSSTGGAVLYANESVELNLVGTSNGTPLLPTPVIVPLWSYSLASNCPAGASSAHALGTTPTSFFAIHIHVGEQGPYLLWTALYTNTTAIETSVSDVYAISCIDYMLGSGSCGTGTGPGSAVLYSVVQS